MVSFRDAAKYFVFETYSDNKSFTNRSIDHGNDGLWSPDRLKHVDVLYIFKAQENNKTQVYVAKNGNP